MRRPNFEALRREVPALAMLLAAWLLALIHAAFRLPDLEGGAFRVFLYAMIVLLPALACGFALWLLSRERGED